MYTFLAVLLLIPVYLYCYLRLLNTATMNFFIAKLALQKNILYLIGNNMFESADLTKVKNIPLSANARVEKFWQNTRNLCRKRSTSGSIP